MEVSSSPSLPTMRGCSQRRTDKRKLTSKMEAGIMSNVKNCPTRTGTICESIQKLYPSRTLIAMHDGNSVTTQSIRDDRWYTSWRRKRLKHLHRSLHLALFIICLCYQFPVGFGSCRKEDGRTVLRELEGVISDGDANYPEDTECQWLIEAPDTQMSICLHFTVFETECTYDFLHIFDGDSFSSPLIGSFSGNKLPPTLCASSGKMLIYLYSDTNYNLQGFEVSYAISDCPEDCLGRGSCVNYQCQCSTGYHGKSCQYYNCPNECGASLSQGSCNYNLAQPKCDCVNGYIGENCSLSTLDDMGWGSSFVLSSGGDDGLTPRTGHGAVYHGEDDTMWVFGGYNLNEILDDFLKYKFVDNTWSAVSPSSGPSPVGRYSHTMDIVDGEIVMFGGILEDGSFSNELWSFDILSEEWSLLPSVLSVPGTAHHSSCVVNETILYIIGGRGNDSFFHHNIYRYDLVARTGWELVEPAGGLPDAIGVAEHSSVYYAPSRTIYVFGGLRENNHKFAVRSSDIYTFNVERRFWQKLSVPSSILYGRTFHTASLVGEKYMVVYGGNTHQHTSSSSGGGKEDCYENSILLFHFDCNSWVDYDVLAQDFTGDVESYSDSGRFGHSTVVRDETTLVITGGFRGIVTNDIIAIKMPGTVAVNPSTLDENWTAEDQCSYHKSYSVCQMDPSCAHCDSTDECINRKYAQHCTGEVKYGECPGVCSQALTCHACLSFDEDTGGSGVTGRCGWCVQERTCYSVSEAYARCGQTSSPGWWGDTMTVIEDFSQCVLEDFPPGMILATHHVPADLEFPDEVEIINVTNQELTVIHDYIPAVSSERGLWSLTGVLHPLNAVPSKQASRLRMFVTSKNIQTKLLMSTDWMASHAENVAVFNSTDAKTVEAFRPFNSTLIPDRSSEYYMRLEGVWLSETDKGYILGLSWNGDTVDTDVISPQYLRPYTSGNCNIHWNCKSCLTDALCGWCPLSQMCELRNNTALPPERCGTSVGTLRHHLTIDSDYCQDCNQYTDCRSCVEGPHCEWFQDKTTLCLRRGSHPEAVKSSSECGLSCYERTSCRECTQLDSCAWCAKDQKCFPFKHYIKSYAYGQCSHWFDEPSHCPNCSALTNCQDCLSNFQCGWCGNSVNPLNGTCILGDFAGPMADQNCSSIVAEIYKTPVTEAADWSYEMCPDVEECKLGIFECHKNASCLNTYKSYECKCNQGFKGDGTDSCVRTCFHDCVNGVCSEAPLYECDCSLGWTGLNCSTDCGCNLHSYCSQGVGICDECYNNTMGEHCGKCQPGSFGDPLRPEGCEQCDCNDHGDPEKGFCDESTQECFCMDNTMGDHCEECQPGFYGDPRNGGRCYLECAGRTVLWNTTEVSLGSFEGDRASDPESTNCLWILSHFEWEEDSTTEASNRLIQLTIDRINTTCGRDYVHVYDGIPESISGLSDSPGLLLGSFCGYGDMDPLTVTAQSGMVTVVFEASLQVEFATTGFTALYEVLDCERGCGSNRSCVDGKCVCDVTHQGELCEQEICPSDCSVDEGKGFCDEELGLCRCSDRFGGSSCNQVNNPGDISRGVWTPLYLPHTHQSEGTVQGRVGHSMFKRSDGHLIIFGGYSEKDGCLNDMWSYNPSDQSWTEITYASAGPSGRYFHGSVYFPSSNQLYVFGGMNETDVFNEFWIYHVVWRNWTKQEIDPNHVIPPLAGHTLTAWNQERFFLVGGFSPQESFYPELQEYHTEEGVWASRFPKGIAPIGIYGHSAVWHEESGALYVYGGYRFARGQVWVSDVLYSYHEQSNIWNILPPASNYVPSPHIFHTAITTSRYLFIIGGGTAERNFTISVQAYHYDCNTWTEVTLNEDGPQPALGQTAVEIDGAVYVYGGFTSKVMGSLYKLSLPEDLCLQHKTIEECRSTPGCTTCVVNDTFFRCTYTESCGGTGSVTVGGAIPNGTIQCNVTEVESNDCEDFNSCGECLTTYPAHITVKSGCKWCYGCPEGACIRKSSNCEDYCENNLHEEITNINKCSELVCAVADCEECRTMRGCMWTRQFQPIAETKYLLTKTPSFSWNCYSNTLLDVTPDEIEILTSPPLSCPSHCHTHSTCWECLESEGADGGWSSCVWSSQLQQCMSPSFLYLQCITGRCGPILYGNSNLCPVPCSYHTGCHSCFQQSNCGWCSVGYNASMGVCMEGTMSIPVDGICGEQTISPTDGLSDEILRLAEEEKAEWHFAICPPENECTNGGHNCGENERCVDTFDSFICECKQKYSKDSEDVCQPVCSQKCYNGTCVAPDTCACNFGFVGESCITPCQCNGHSDCAGPEDTHNCTDCRDNTMGPACEFCQTFFVGNATNGGVCEPCSNKCNGNSDVCVSLRKYNQSDRSSWENMPGPTEDDILCLNCSNNSEGDRCESCKDGFFRLDNVCQPCQCNGHSDTCDKVTGEGCLCQNHTRSPNCPSDKNPSPCYQHQCSICTEGEVFHGEPTNNHQCYRQVEMNLRCFGDGGFRTGCPAGSGGDPLPPGKSVLYVVQPSFVDLDIRVTIDVTYGSMDVYISHEPDMFVVKSENGMHTVMIDPEKEVDNTDIIPQDENHGAVGRKKRQSNSVTASTDQTVNKVTAHYAEGLNSFVKVMDSEFVMVIRNVENRLVVTIPHRVHTLSTKWFYFILLATENSQPRNDTPGALVYRQDIPQIDLFIFFSAFLSSFFKLLAILIAIWKLKVSWETRQAERARSLEMEHRRSRPFGHAIVYMEEVADPLPAPPTHPSRRTRRKSPRSRKERTSGSAVSARSRHGAISPPAVSPPPTNPPAGTVAVHEKLPYAPGLIALEPTDDGMAGVGTVVISLPGGTKAPLQACLGSGLMRQSKHNLSLMHPPRLSRPANKQRQNSGCTYRPV